MESDYAPGNEAQILSHGNSANTWTISTTGEDPNSSIVANKAVSTNESWPEWSREGRVIF